MANLGQPRVNPPQPVPDYGIASYPTPKIHDRIVREVHDSQGQPYEPLPYGTPYNSVVHTAYQVSLPDHQLAFQGPAPGDPSGRMVQRIWVNPRANADSYNYSTKFSDEDPDYPIIIRTNVVKRDEWVPKEPLTPDPVNPECLLISQEMLNETDPPDINSLYVTIVEVYERIPGPIVTTGDFDTELNIMVYTDRQSVLSSDQANPSSNPLILELKESPRSKYTKLRITSYLQELPEPKVEYQTGRYPFPALLLDVDLTKETLTSDPNRSEINVESDLRAAPDAPAKLRITTTFYDSPPPDSITIYVLSKRDIAFRGTSYQLQYSNVLTNTISTSASFTGDERYGDLSEGYTIPSSTPSASSYLSTVVGTYRIVGANITRWRGQIWVSQVTEVYMI